jgi:hypothetical protein
MESSLTVSTSIEERLTAPIERVWHLLTDFHALPRRMAGVTHFVVEGSGVGAVRTFQINNGPVLRERIEALESERYRFVYSLLPPAFLENYTSEIRLTPDGPLACVVTWSGECTVASEKDTDERRSFLENIYRNGIAWARKEAEKD